MIPNCVKNKQLENRVNTMIETITNENGTAIKFSDGTMICRAKIAKENFLATEEIYNTAQNIKIYRSNLFIWNFPVQFINQNIATSISSDIGIYGTRLNTSRTSNLTKSSVTIQFLALESFIESGLAYKDLNNVDVIAIGRWK